jgi:RHS repeat-associated protein
MPIGVNQNGTLHGILVDQLNSPRQVFKLASQDIVWNWSLFDDAFGENIADEDPDSDSTLFRFDMRFPGQLYDVESGLHHNYFRDYDAANGRYTESDPIGLEGGMNEYGYGASNPLINIDPNGLTTTTVTNSGLIFPDYAPPSTRPMPLPRPGPSPGMRWGPRILGACRLIAGVSAGQLTVAVIAAVYPSSTSPCSVAVNKPQGCPIYLQESETTRCANVRAVCREKCSKSPPLGMPGIGGRTNQSNPFFICVNQCLDDNGCL